MIRTFIAFLLSFGAMDWTSPTLRDYKKLQKELSDGERPELAHMDDAIKPISVTPLHSRERVRNFRFYSKKIKKVPTVQHVYFDDDPSNRETCILSYASFNANYEWGVKRLKRRLKNIGYKGHFLYMIGGWPNVEEGDLKLYDVPYAFKISFFRLAKRLGYKKVLWLDSSMNPLRPIDEIFAHMEKTGFFLQTNTTPFHAICAPTSLDYFQLTPAETKDYTVTNTGLLGFNFANPKASEVLSDWYKAALSRSPFFTSYPEQTVFTIIVNKHKLTHLAYPHIKDHIKENAPLIHVDYPSTH